MEALQVLGEEHFWIARMLDCLELVAMHERETGELDGEAAEELLDLFHSFADGRHQEKEERHLFPRIRVHADAEQETLIQKLEMDHEGDVRHMIRLRSALQGAVHGDAVMQREFSRTALEYVGLERKHMSSERLVLFPLAERLLTDGDDKAMLEAFAKLDPGGPRARERTIERIALLCEQLGVESGSESTG